jgi:hypothetical protein
VSAAHASGAKQATQHLLGLGHRGAAFGDIRSHDGAVRDPERQDYLEGYIRAVGRAVQAGVPVSGYFVWSFLDNFEWATLCTAFSPLYTVRLRQVLEGFPAEFDVIDRSIAAGTGSSRAVRVTP